MDLRPRRRPSSPWPRLGFFAGAAGLPCRLLLTAVLPVLLAAGCKKEPDEPVGNGGPRYATEFTSVRLDPATPAPVQLAVQACAGLMNRELGGSVYVQMEPHDDTWLEELALVPAEVVDAADFLEGCVAEIPACVRYTYADQQELLPAILSAASALGAVPLDTGSGTACADVAFDATVALKSRNTPEQATRHVFEAYGARTAGLAMLNPGYELQAPDLSNPDLNREMPSAMVDFVFSERLFVTFLVNGCIDGDPEKDLLHEIVNAGHWPTPLGVYGYNNSWLAGGYVYEAQTRCLDSRNMGAIPTETGNLSFFATRRPPITEPGELEANPLDEVVYDPSRTYVAFVVGDGDNIRFIMTTRNVWLGQRQADCERPDSTCPPLTWSISPHLTRLAPDVLEWYFAQIRQTGHDYFTLPPSGHLYAYPTSLAAADQDRFVRATEEDARVLGVQTTVHWDWFDTWADAEDHFLPKYAHAGGPIRGFVPVNVPYLAEAFPWWPAERFYAVLPGADGTEVAVFRPRQWRGVDDSDDTFFVSPARMAAEIEAYPPGTVTAIYMTSDGGLSLENSVLELVDLLPERVQLVSADTAARLAVEAGQRR